MTTGESSTIVKTSRSSLRCPQALAHNRTLAVTRSSRSSTTGPIDNYRPVLTVRSIVLEEVDVADHADQLAFVHDGHGTEFVERQKVSHLVKRCVR